MSSKVSFSLLCTFPASVLSYYENGICGSFASNKAMLHVVNFYRLSHWHLNNSIKDLQCMFQHFIASVRATFHILRCPCTHWLANSYSSLPESFHL